MLKLRYNTTLKSWVVVGSMVEILTEQKRYAFESKKDAQHWIDSLTDR